MGVSRGYLFRVSVLGALMLAMVALSAAVATAEAAPDASCQVTSNTWSRVGVEPGWAPGMPGSNVTQAQTFTALNSGRLATAEVPLIDSKNTGTLVVEIRSVDGTSGAPSTTVLASTSILASEIPGESTVSVDFSPGPAVVDGQQYALVLRSADGTFSVKAFYDYNDPSGPSCPGMQYVSINGGASFGARGSSDMIFSTFVTPSNVVATNDSYSTAQDTPLRIAAPGLLSNDTDSNGAPITAAKVTDPAHGEVFVDADGSFGYFPDAGYLGTDSFTYRASDGEAVSNTATVRITVKDATAPTITPVSPRHGSVTRDTTPTIRATVTDNNPLAKANVKLYVAGRLISATKFSYAPSTGALVYNSPRLAKGKKTVKIVATDAAGNALTKSWVFTIR